MFLLVCLCLFVATFCYFFPKISGPLYFFPSPGDFALICQFVLCHCLSIHYYVVPIFAEPFLRMEYLPATFNNILPAAVCNNFLRSLSFNWRCFIVSWYRSYSAFVKLQWSPTHCESDCLEVSFLELNRFSFKFQFRGSLKSTWNLFISILSLLSGIKVKTRLLFYASHKCEAAFFLCPHLTSSL